MKIVAWNIRHGGGRRLARIETAIARHRPDLLVLSEFRNNPTGALLRAWLKDFGHMSQASGETSAPAVNTVLISSSHEIIFSTYPELGPNAHRCLGAKIGDRLILGFYFPVMLAKQPVFDFIRNLPKKLLTGETVLIGDMNTGCRYWDEGRMDLSLVEQFGAVLGCGWTDAWRQRHPGIREWSWVESWGRRVGYRLDHALVSPVICPHVANVFYSHEEREAGISDHSVLVLELKD